MSFPLINQYIIVIQMISHDHDDREMSTQDLKQTTRERIPEKHSLSSWSPFMDKVLQ